jgi:biopolymer transport protein ExbD
MAHSRLSPRTLIVAAMLVSGSLAAPAFAPALAQRPPAGQPAGTALNKQMVPLYNDAIKSMQASDWAGAKPKLDAAYAAAKTPQPELHLRADRDTRYQVLAEVMSMARVAGVTRIGFVTDPSAGPAGLIPAPPR